MLTTTIEVQQIENIGSAEQKHGDNKYAPTGVHR